MRLKKYRSFLVKQVIFLFVVAQHSSKKSVHIFLLVETIYYGEGKHINTSYLIHSLNIVPYRFFQIRLFLFFFFFLTEDYGASWRQGYETELERFRQQV